MSPTLHIRSATLEDFDALAAHYTRVAPDDPVQAAELRAWDRLRDPKLDFKCFVLDEGERIIAAAGRSQQAWMYHPRKFALELTVDPERRRRGIGAALYAHLLASLAPFDPLALRARSREDRADALRFLERRGFVEEEREWESWLNPQTAPLGPLLGVPERLEAEGMVFASLAELMRRDPDHRAKLYALETEAGADAPQADTFTPPSFEAWQARVFEDPNFLPEGILVALEGWRYVGLSQFWRSQTPGAGLHNGFTGVIASHRGRGVATALKVRNLLWARSQGVTRVRTFNRADNAAMLAVNRRLGYERRPAWIGFVRVMQEGS